ncbi:MAG: hypothetical protein FWD53_11825 [Phycisphaerales bacterium]|nr:hypothetical protein [Phycisphaerales bacterium]
MPRLEHVPGDDPANLPSPWPPAVTEERARLQAKAQWEREAKLAMERAKVDAMAKWKIDWNDEKAVREAIMLIVPDSSSTAHHQLALACEIFVEKFPNSARHREMLDYGIVGWSYCLNRKNDRDYCWVYLREMYRKYVLRYQVSWDDPKEKRGSWRHFKNITSRDYLFLEAQWHVMRESSEHEIEDAAAAWQAAFGGAKSAAPHSDFLRLKILALKKQKLEFLKLLKYMQQQHPDPKDPYWHWHEYNGVRDFVSGEISRMFHCGSDKCGFRLWFEGKGEIGDVPWKGWNGEESWLDWHSRNRKQ